MHYFVDMYDGKLNFLENISNDTCKEVLELYDDVKETLDYYVLGKCVRDAWDELILWSNETDNNNSFIIRNLHTAERLVRGFLFEFRTCLDHMETDIKRKYGKDSELWRIFQEGTSSVYDNYPEYAFTYHLRNCSQHCKSVVHGFVGNTGIGISSNVNQLLTSYEKWKLVDKEFMSAAGENIDLMSVFSKTFSAFNEGLRPVIQYLLDTDRVCDKLIYLRNWGNSLCNQFKHEISNYHIVNIVGRDGQDAKKEEMAIKDIVVNAYPFDWKMIYELTDSLEKRAI